MKQLNLFEKEYENYMNEILSWNEQLTPIENIDGQLFKREDKFKIFDVCGAKSRQAYYLISKSRKPIIVTCGSRVSPQIQIVANICKHTGKKCICFAPYGKITDELQSAIDDGAIIKQEKNWFYNNVIIHHAKKYCEEHTDCEYIPFGMESLEAVRQTAYQVKNIPNDVKSIIVVAGSGLNLCGIMWGCKVFNKNIHIKAVSVGKDIKEILSKYAPSDYDDYEIIKSSDDYHEKVKENVLKGIELDPIYEAKCIPHIKENDLFWIIGKRKETTK